MAHPANQETINLVKEIFRNYLKENKQRQTPERFMVLEEIYRSEGHFDAEQIFFNMKDTNSRVSRATVYNTLELLLSCGLVQRHQFGENQSYYERSYAYKQHDHIICTNTNKVIEFCDPRIQEIKSLMERIYNVKIVDHSLNFYAIDLSAEEEEKKAEQAIQELKDH